MWDFLCGLQRVHGHRGAESRGIGYVSDQQEELKKSYQADVQLRLDALRQDVKSKELEPLPPDAVTASCKSGMYIITGLLYKDDAEVMRMSLHRSAGCPPHRRGRDNDIAMDDTSSWSLENLRKLGLVQLVPFVEYAHRGYRCPLQLPAVLLRLSTCAYNIQPFSEFLHAADKMDLVHSDGRLIDFHLDRRAFEQGTYANSRHGLRRVADVLWTGEERARHFLTLHASPLNGITLLEAARLSANIPQEAKFYTFCYPVLHSLETALALEALDVDKHDPFVVLLTRGAYMYFDHTYDICAINAVCFDADNIYQGEGSRINFDTAMPLPPMPRSHLDECERWWPVTTPSMLEQGFTHFAWVTASEILGDYIFTPSGGFAYRHRDPDGSKFYPVVPPWSWSRDPAALAEQLAGFESRARVVPLPYDSPLNIEELVSFLEGSALNGKFVHESASFTLTFAREAAALGIKHVIGIDRELLLENGAGASAEVRREIAQAAKDGAFGAGAEDIDNLSYVLDAEASELEVTGNDGHKAWRDRGHGGMRLQDFCEHSSARLASLDKPEVAALRLYTTSTFRRINDPLRRGAKPVPLPYTTKLIYDALKKMRAIHLSSRTQFRKRYLWRGLRNCAVDDEFLCTGGTELACMSTSPNMRVVAGYAKSDTPLLLRLLVEGPMSMGADIQWLSVFPGEEEVLYPPLTYLKVFCKQRIRGVDNGTVITVKPSFPT